MKSERRHELQHNVLEDYVFRVAQRVKPYARAITGGILAVLVLIGTYWYLNRRADAERATAWERTWQAIYSPDTKKANELRSVVESYPNTPAASWAQLALADQELAGVDGGVNTLFTDKAAGRTDLRAALEDYQAVEQAATDPLLQQHALYGIGRAQESLNQLEKAKEAFERLTKNYPDGPYFARAKQQLDSLTLDSTKSFYDWFANFEPRTRGTSMGTDSGKSPFEGLPPLPPDLKLPGVGSSKTPPPEPKPDQGPAKKGSTSTPPKSPDTKPAETKPTETKPADTKPAEPKPDTKPADAKPADTKAGDAKSSDAKPAETKPGDTKPAESKP